MKPQDKYPYDTIMDRHNIFHPVGSNSYYVNSSSILATEKIITIGKEYIIFDSPGEPGIKMSDVELMDVFYKKGIINLIVRNIKLNREYIICHCIECPESDCKWILIDINYFIDKMNIKAIQSYCENCNDPLKKPHTKINYGSSSDDLLEFDY
jgi:hypothetical protein